MATASASTYGTGSRRRSVLGLADERVERWGSRVRCALVGHEFAAGVAGIVLQLPTCQRCGHDREN